MIFERPPTEAQLEAIGFDPKQRFGIEFEFFNDSDRDYVAQEIRQVTGINCWAERYNHDDGPNWKIVTDGSLGSDDDEDTEYDCANCDTSRECDHDCESTCRPTFICGHCNVPSYEREACCAEHEGDTEYCEANNEDPQYDCDDCEQDRYCDEYCGDHCEPTYHGNGGMELVSPPLIGFKGMTEVYRVLDCLNTMHPTINDACGLHIHLDANGLHLPEYRTLVKLYLKYERTLDEVMPHSRRSSNQCHAYSLLRFPMRYEGKVKQHFREMDKEPSVNRLINHHMCDRYMKLNISARRSHGTVEFRHHSGTTSFEKTVHWVALCQGMLGAAKRQVKVRIDKDPLDYVLPIESLMRVVKAPPLLRRYWYDRHDHFKDEVEAEREAEQKRIEAQIKAQQAQDRYERRCSAMYRIVNELRDNPSMVPTVPLYGVLGMTYFNNLLYLAHDDPEPEPEVDSDVIWDPACVVYTDTVSVSANQAAYVRIQFDPSPF